MYFHRQKDIYDENNLNDTSLLDRAKNFGYQLEQISRFCELVDKLHKSGHFQYKTYEFKWKLTENSAEKWNELIEKIEKELKDWLIVAEEIKQQFPYLNFFKWEQLHKLSELHQKDLGSILQSLLSPLNLKLFDTNANLNLVRQYIFYSLTKIYFRKILFEQLKKQLKLKKNLELLESY